MEIKYELFDLDRKKESLNDKEIEYLDTLSVEEINYILSDMKKKANYYNSMQLALKLILNSVYGAFGNEFFVCSTKDIAGAITAMGRDLIKHMDNINESYWYDYWHLDEELHEHLGIKTSDITPINNEWVHRESKTNWDNEVTALDIEEGIYQRKVPVGCYIDTDSGFYSFEPAMKSCNWKGDPQEFIMKICKFRLEPLFLVKLKKYAKRFNVENIHDFELENINESVLFITKKKYIKHTIWEDGRQYDRLSYIVPKGVDLIQKGTPKFAREKVMDIIKYLFKNSETYNIKDLLKFVRDLKKEFELTDINDICPSVSINAYYSSKIMVDGKIIDSPGIINDKDKFEYAKATYFTVKASGLYNYLLHQNPDLINTYERIQPGIKAKIYPTTHELNDKFCYPLGAYPKEFAPEVDYDVLFQKTVNDQVNYYIEALDLPKLNKRLKVVMSLF